MTESQPEAGPHPRSPSPLDAPGAPSSRRSRREADAVGKATAPSAAAPSKAGRNLPAAIVVGLVLLGAVLGGLFVWPLGFVVIATAAGVLGVWEVFRALQTRKIVIPIVPVLIGAIAIPFSAFFGGQEAQLFALLAASAAVLLWQSLESAVGAVANVVGGVFVLLWIPFFIGFSVLPLHDSGVAPPPLGLWPGLVVPHSVLQLVLTLLLVFANDTFGYIVGASLGKHPMAPKISPKKSWEGFAGSVAGALVIGVLGTVLLLGRPWWVGVVLAIAMVGAATAGDLAESMVKRELGIKDMSSILPGHGGMMDRLDSILFGVPVAYVVFSLLPTTG
ncbi:phosphatidate cytidylyltransferase [Sinomonas sp. JGH33]|uniref:Phosphatidate cytidylyltransferase n=1 Tax=Sinomonas terricola TaxID=3110330 RepID=A0ABU5T4M2_9MICC|nr:phosphatidate cytidylyltransferase [Sinomonas sp. JGH33]MEA5454621.1 phosphatidate cytidylyltransferase [Sinomonas sp. JGH33]